LVFIDPLPSEDDYAIMYSSSYHDDFYFGQKRGNYSNIATLIRVHAKGRRLLDFGCGDGAFVRYFTEQGFIGTGVEYAPELVARLSAQPGNSEKYMTCEEFWHSSERFDVIHLGDVLEHMDRPLHLVHALSGRLRPSTGILVVEGPLENNRNIALFARKIVSGMKSTILRKQLVQHAPYHVTFSDATNQKQFFERCCLRTLSYKVWEENWPYPSEPSCRPGTLFKFGVAKISVFVSSAMPRHWGNRFTYVGMIDSA